MFAIETMRAPHRPQDAVEHRFEPLRELNRSGWAYAISEDVAYNPDGDPAPQTGTVGVGPRSSAWPSSIDILWVR